MVRSGGAFFYERSSAGELILDDEDYESSIQDEHKPSTMYEKMGIIENYKRQTNDTNKPERKKKKFKQSDRVLQILLQAGKLLEGRISFAELCKMDIATFQKVVDNELHNIDASIEDYQKHGRINAYTKYELAKNNDAAYLREFNKTLESGINKK